MVEAKRTATDAAVGKQQAKEYANCLENETKRRPIIFYTNGYEINIWDDVRYPPRSIQGFYTKDELELMIQRRETRQTLNQDNINKEIVGRHYQLRAISKVAENFEQKNQRKALTLQRIEARIVHPVGPAHIDPRQDPCHRDHQRPQQDPDTQPRHHQRPHQRLVVRDQQNEAEVDRDHHGR